MISFPRGFFWGAATSSYQVEGNNRWCDWWEWEKRALLKYPSGDACRQYSLFKEDFDIARQLNHNCHRISVEWSRIEREEGIFVDEEIAHYRAVIAELSARKITAVVTLWHFTLPKWFVEKGGWERKGNIFYFLRFAEHLVERLADGVTFWATINEPMVYAYQSYCGAVWPPQKKSFLTAYRVTGNLIRAHIQAYRTIHRIYAAKKYPPPRVSIAHNIRAFVPCTRALKNRAAAKLRDYFFNRYFLSPLVRLRVGFSGGKLLYPRYG